MECLKISHLPLQRCRVRPGLSMNGADEKKNSIKKEYK